MQMVAAVLRPVCAELTTRPAIWSRRLPQKLHCVLGSILGSGG